MSPGERKLIDYIESRLESMLRRPAVWGSNLAIEQRVLQLLEMRWLVLEPTADVADVRRVKERFVGFLGANLQGATPQPLAVQLERAGRSEEFCAILGRFVEEELAALVREGRMLSSGEAQVGQVEVDRTDRLLDAVRAEAEARARNTRRRIVEPISLGKEEAHE